jgi:hypothetical protein
MIAQICSHAHCLTANVFTACRSATGDSIPKRVAGALKHAPDNISASLPDSVRDWVDRTDRRERAEKATDAGARASSFTFPPEAAKVAQDRAAQAQDQLQAHTADKGTSVKENMAPNRGQTGGDHHPDSQAKANSDAGTPMQNCYSTSEERPHSVPDGSTNRDRNSISGAIWSAEETVEQWAERALRGLRTYFHDAEEAAQRGIHYAEHLYERREEIARDVGKPADEAGHKLAEAARGSVARAESSINKLSHQGYRAKEATKSAYQGAESAVESAVDEAAHVKDAAKSTIRQVEDFAESARERVASWFYDTKEAGKRGIHYTENVGKGIYGVGQSIADGVESVSAGLANRAIDAKESVKKGIHYAESVYGDADAALGRIGDNVASAEETGKDFLGRTAASVMRTAPDNSRDEGDLVSGGTQARKTWAEAGQTATSSRCVNGLLDSC